MRWLLVFLVVLVGASFGLPECPERVPVDGDLNDCSSFCQTVFKGGSIKAFGYPPSERLIGVCGCLYENLVDNQVVGSVYCEYSIGVRNQSVLKKAIESYGGKEPLINSLVRVATFDKTAPFSGYGYLEVLQRGLYSLYVNALTSVSVVLSAYLLTMLAGWWVATQGYSEWGRILRSVSGGESFSVATATESFKKFSAILLGIAVFSFPIPTSSPVHQGAGVGVSQEVYSTDPCKEYQEYQNKLQNQSNTGDAEVDEAMDNSKRQISQDLEDLKRKCEESQQNSQSDKLFKVEKDPQRIYLPVALAIVKSFVNFGLSQADAIAQYTNEWIKAYFVKKLSDSQIVVKESLEVQRKEYQKTIQELEDLKSKVLSQAGDCQFSCAYLITLTERDKASLLADKPQCKAPLELTQSICRQILSLRQKQVDTIGQQTQEQQRQETIAKSIDQNVGFIQQVGGFASPSITPIVASFSIFGSVNDLDAPKYEAVRIKVERQLPDLRLARFGVITDRNESQENFFNFKGDEGVSFGGVVGSTQDAWDKSKMFWLGQLVVFTSIPPGSLFADSMIRVVDAVKSMIDSIANFIAVFPGLVIVGKGIGVLTTAFKGVGSMVAMVFAYGLSVMFFKVAPFVVIAFAILFRVIAYLVELIVFVLSIPFFGVMVATRREGVALNFFKKTIKLMTFPIIIAFTPLVAFFVVELYYFFFYYLPVSILDQFMPDSFMGNFFLGAFTALLYIFATALAMFSGWNVAYHLPEDFYSLFSEALSGVETRLAGRLEGVRGVVGRFTGASM